MINKKSISAVAASQFGLNFCKPLYHSYNFSKIPGTIEKLLLQSNCPSLPEDVVNTKSNEPSGVVLFFIDGFGWVFFEKYLEQFPVLRRFLKHGTASKITSLFPSTTAAHTTCIHSGLEPGQSSIYEWFIYEPKLERIIAPLPFSFAGDHKVESLHEAGFSSKDLFPNKTLYHKLISQAVKCFTMQHSSISKSTYSQSFISETTLIEYEHFPEALDNLVHLISSMKTDKFYCFVYLEEIDAVAHRHGIESEFFDKTVRNFLEQLEEGYFKKLEHSSKNIATLITADHGLTSVNPKKTFYLNQEIHEIIKNFKMGKNQKPLAPAGSCRDFFLHLKEDKVYETKEILEHFLEDKASIYFTKQLIDEKFFGQNPVSAEFLNRVGNLVILPRKGEAIWWFEKNHFSQNFYAAHGGLTREEMEIPLLFMPGF